MGALLPLVERILEKRGIEDKEAFLNPQYHTRHDPFLLTDMEKAVSRIFTAIEHKEKICVWHDYDCDGVPGGALLFDFFKTIGYPISAYVPERSEGYGLNSEGLEKLKTEGVSLVFTVDCGITDVAEAARAKELGIDLIITDHHLPGKTLPSAFAVINPHRADDTYPYKGLCGTGVAFKLVEGVVAKGKFALPEGFEKWLLDLVALATVADMVPITGENRALVHFGLKVIHKGRRPGLRAIFEREKMPLQYVTEDDLAFSVAPKINAASRMASPKIAFELLTTDSPERAAELAKKLEGLNKERKLEGMQVAKDVKKKIDALPQLGSIVVMGSQSWRPSLLGIAATSVVETYGKTVCLWGKDGELIKGSCRSAGDVNIVTLMAEAKDAFLDFGGHEYSGGFSVSPEDIHLLPARLEEAFVKAAEGRVVTDEKIEHDGDISLSEVTDGFFDALRTLAPFGQENPKPIFSFRGVTVARILRFGGHKEHTRLTLKDAQGASADAICFFTSRQTFKDALEFLSEGDAITLEGSVERSHFRGKKELRLRIQALSY